MEGNYLKFWGTRGSNPVSGESYQQFGGNTCCVEVHHEGHCIILDAGSGIFPLGKALCQNKVRKIDLLLGHAHWDHVMGLPYFEPLYDSQTHITLWSAQDGKHLFKQLFSMDFFPVAAKDLLDRIEFRTIDPTSSFHIGSLRLSCHRVNHPGVALGFKLQNHQQTIGYVSDNEVFQGLHEGRLTPQEIKPYESFIDFFRGCDLFIHEAQYFPDQYRLKTGWGHSSVQNVVAMIGQILPRQWLVTHHDPSHTDEDLLRLMSVAKQLLQTDKIPCPVQWLSDGLSIRI